MPLIIITRLHSSRMRTARSLTVSPSMLCEGEGGCLLPRGGVSASLGVSASRGCLLPRGVSASWGGCLLPGVVCFQGLSASGGCLLLGGLLLGDVYLQGVSAPRGGVASQHALRQTPPCEQKHTRL